MTESKPVKRWRYLVPNAITLGSMGVGLGAMGQAVTGEYAISGWLIILCALLDKLDGTAARLLGSTSEIGSQLDSFSDFVAFGIAPATLVFTLIRGLPPDSGMGPYAWWHPDWPSYLLHFLCAVYVTCATVRLAKFNVLKGRAVDLTGTPVFYGIPTTMAGGLVAAACLVGLEHDLFGLIVFLPAGLFVLGLCMVLNFPFPQMSRRPSKLVNAFVGINLVLSYTVGLLRIWPEYLFGLIAFFFIWGLFWSLRYHKTLGPANLDPFAQ